MLKIKNTTWQLVSGGLSKLLHPSEKKMTALSQCNYKNNKFSVLFTTKDDSLPSLKKIEKDCIDLKVLDILIKEALPKEISCKGLLSSHLQAGKINADSHQQMEQVLALHKMKKLVTKTVLETKKIKLNYASYHQG